MLCFLFAALIVVLDQFFKRWVTITLASGGETVIIENVISLIYVENTGAAFSILANQRWLLVGLAFIAAIVLIAILLRYTDGFWGTLGLAAVLGGTVGNLIDRVFNGYVVDMFRWTLFFEFAIFNIADIFITLGFITFCIHFIVTATKSAALAKASANAAPDEQLDEIYSDFDLTDDIGDPDYDGTSEMSDTKVLPPPQYEPQYEPQTATSFEGGSTVPDDSVFYEQEPVQVYYEPEPAPMDEVESALDTLSALSELESELDSIDNYDIDKLLQDYGFEDDLP